MTDPAIVRPPFGADVDGRRLLGEAVGFGRALRAARLSVDLGAAADFARALTLVDIGDREQVRGAGAAIFTRRRDDREIYDAVFDRWWRRRGSRVPGTFDPPSMPDPNAPAEGEEAGGALPEAGEDAHGPAAGRARHPDPVRRRRRRRRGAHRRAWSSHPTRTARARSFATASSTA